MQLNAVYKYVQNLSESRTLETAQLLRALVMIRKMGMTANDKMSQAKTVETNISYLNGDLGSESGLGIAPSAGGRRERCVIGVIWAWESS